jgi:hypothetical protein
MHYRAVVETSTRCFSVLNRPTSKYEGHVPLTGVERFSLAVGSAIGSLVNPHRGGSRTSVPLYYDILSSLRFDRSLGRSYGYALLYIQTTGCYVVLV